MRPTDLLPIMLNARDLRVLVVGGGNVAVRKVRSLLEAGASVTVVAPEVSAEMPAGADVRREPFDASQIAGVSLVVAATNNSQVNAAAQSAAAAAGIWCARLDSAEAGDFILPATVRAGPIVASVSAGSPALAKRLCEAISNAAAPFAELATVAETLRPRILSLAPDAASSRAAMRDLTSDEAVEVLNREGGEALQQWIADRHAWLRGLWCNSDSHDTAGRGSGGT